MRKHMRSICERGASLIAEMKDMTDQNSRLKKMYAEMSMQNELLKEALGNKRYGRPLPDRRMLAFADRVRGERWP